MKPKGVRKALSVDADVPVVTDDRADDVVLIPGAGCTIIGYTCKRDEPVFIGHPVIVSPLRRTDNAQVTDCARSCGFG